MAMNPRDEAILHSRPVNASDHEPVEITAAEREEYGKTLSDGFQTVNGLTQAVMTGQLCGATRYKCLVGLRTMVQQVAAILRGEDDLKQFEEFRHTRERILFDEIRRLKKSLAANARAEEHGHALNEIAATVSRWWYRTGFLAIRTPRFEPHENALMYVADLVTEFPPDGYDFPTAAPDEDGYTAEQNLACVRRTLAAVHTLGGVGHDGQGLHDTPAARNYIRHAVTARFPTAKVWEFTSKTFTPGGIGSTDDQVTKSLIDNPYLIKSVRVYIPVEDVHPVPPPPGAADAADAADAASPEHPDGSPTAPGVTVG